MVSAILLDTFTCSMFWGSKSAMLFIISELNMLQCIYKCNVFQLGSKMSCLIIIYAHSMETIPSCDNGCHFTF